MAAYGALVSVMQIMHHPHPPISLHKLHVESLTANLTFLLEFLEVYNPRRTYNTEVDPLESRIEEAAYVAEDVIESYIVDQIHARSTDHAGKISSTEFFQGLEKVIEEMDVMKMEIIEKKMQGFQIIKKESTTDAAGSSRSSSTAEKVTTMVGLDEVLYEMLDTITGGERVRKIIPIVGMGGLGKTTLARNIYAHQLVKEHFDICAWSTISQVHNAQKIFKEILGQVGLDNGGDLSEGDLGVKLYKHLIGKRYLIVMDDMWSIEAWDKVRSFFPENENGSRVVVTTRLSNLASKFNYSDGLDMKFLDKASSWNLFQRTVFGEGICPLDMKDIGKKIVEGCRGLPLSIVVVGGLLSKSEATRENWEVVEENLTSFVNAEDEGSCLQILYMSYNNLPVHLKPCFLYMGVFPEDDEIEVLTLIPKWVAEGFIKPVDGKSLEEAAEEYLEELVERNLVMVEKRNYYGKLKYCKVHDLLRDLALREGENHRFLYWLKQSSGDRDNSQGTLSTQRRIATTSDPQEYTSSTLLLESVESAGASSLVRSLIGNFPEETLSLPSFRLVRVCMIETLSDGEEESSDEYSEEESSDDYYEEVFNRLLNLRFLLVNAKEHPLPRILSSSVFSLWNLQTLILKGDDEVLVLEIWKMPLLRHVITNLWAFCLPDPPPLGGDEVVMENLHTLSEVRNLNLSEEVFTRIPNIRILKLFYEEESESESEEEGDEEGESEEDEDEDEEDEDEEDEDEEEEEDEEEDEEGDYYSLNNLHRLNKLQELSLIRYGWSSRSMRQLILPHSIKQLTLEGSKLPWEEMASKIGWLPLLQVLILKERSFIGSEWETVEGQFSSLKFLKIEESRLECWTTDNTHFPRLEHLQLRLLKRLREVPSSIGDIPTLRSIELDECSDSAVESARTIVDEQEELGNQDIQLQVFY